MRKNIPLVIFILITATTLCIAQTDAASKSKPMQTDSKTLDQKLIDNSRAAWEAYKSKNVAAIKALAAEEYVSYTLAGPSSLKQDIDTIGKLNIENYSIDDPKVIWATKDVAILRYKCDLKGSMEGKTFVPVYSTEVWVNRGGKWQIVSYQETPVN
jgi:Domain of unknown function (DUF4440)